MRKDAKKTISFKDLRTVDYRPGEDELIKRNGKRRKQDLEIGTTEGYNRTWASVVKKPTKEKKPEVVLPDYFPKKPKLDALATFRRSQRNSQFNGRGGDNSNYREAYSAQAGGFVYLKKESLPTAVKKACADIWKICRKYKARPVISVQLEGQKYLIDVELGGGWIDHYPGIEDKLWKVVPWDSKTMELQIQASITPKPKITISESTMQKESVIQEYMDDEGDQDERFIKSIINKDNVKLKFMRRGTKMTDPIVVYVNGTHEKGPYRSMGIAQKAVKKMSHKELMSENFVVKAVTKDGEGFTSGVHKTKKQAHDMHWKMAKNNKYKSVQVVKKSSNNESLSDLEREEGHPRMTLDEVLSFIQRRKKAISFRKTRAKVKMGAKRQASKAADPARLKRRSKRGARAAVFRRLARGQSKADVPIGKRISIEKRMARMGKRIERVAMKQLPKIRKMDQQRRRNRMTKLSDK